MISSLLCNVSSDPKKPKFLIDRHLERYVSKNTFDYFIHKNLHEFLSRELDFYIKNDVIHLNDIDTANEKLASTYLAKARAIKAVGQVLIDFLAQIEDFQKKCGSRKICCQHQLGASRWTAFLILFTAKSSRTRRLQVQEWISLYAIDLLDGFRKSSRRSFLYAIKI